MKLYIIFFLLIFFYINSNGQTLPVGFPIFEENVRRNQLNVFNDSVDLSLRPRIYFDNSDSNKSFKVLPMIFTSQLNSNRPYGWGNYGMIPNRGIQQYASFGIYAKYKFMNIQFNPEVVVASNSPYPGFSNEFTPRIISDRFRILNRDDAPERFGEGSYRNIWWGQSKITLQLGAFETGISTQNVWWGPGQWNALIFSNNAQGFPHLTLNTSKLAKTFIGNFEGQLIMGRLENSGLGPTQFEDVNNRFFRPFTGDWRYLNALTISYNPKWVPGFFLGFTRTYQQYNEDRGNSLRDYFPIFDPFQKERVFDNQNSVDFDAEARDQQLSVFARFVAPKAKAEIYFEFGKRDHNFNWREAIINPEHARAYLFGFKKLFSVPKENQIIQVRGEITHQQESVNRYIRYAGLVGGDSWHTHYQVRGFTNYGQPLGVGIGTGSNVQTLEVSLVEKLNKMGILFERLENHQDFYYRAFGQQKEHQPWIDLSVGFLFDKQWNNLLLSSKLQLINGMNYQWQLHPNSTPDFPKGQNLFSVHAQTSLIYIWNQPKAKND